MSAVEAVVFKHRGGVVIFARFQRPKVTAYPAVVRIRVYGGFRVVGGGLEVNIPPVIGRIKLCSGKIRPAYFPTAAGWRIRVVRRLFRRSGYRSQQPYNAFDIVFRKLRRFLEVV